MCPEHSGVFMFGPSEGSKATKMGVRCIFLLTFVSNNLIYESRCALRQRSAQLDVRENYSMKNATKKAAKKAAKKAPAKKKK
jgi:hypothetical protein